MLYTLYILYAPYYAPQHDPCLSAGVRHLQGAPGDITRAPAEPSTIVLTISDRTRKAWPHLAAKATTTIDELDT